MMALFGANGGIGRRYQAVLRLLGTPFIPIEIEDELTPKRWTSALIATPTSTHFEIAEFLESLEIPYLIEKPATMDVAEAEKMKSFRHGYIVNNYSFVAPKTIESISYDFYNTGKDGLAFDCIQLLYLAQRHRAKISIHRKSPIWNCYFNEERIDYCQIENSYLDMLHAFFEEEREKLWPASEALSMIEAVRAIDDSKGFIMHEYKL